MALLLLCGIAAAVRIVPPEADGVRSLYIWDADIEAFGGYSGLWADAAGREIALVSDQGYYLTGSLQRRDDAITGVEVAAAGELLDHKSETAPSFHRDAEGLARAADGAFYVAYEGWHRIYGFAALDERPRVLMRVWDAFLDLPGNQGMEAVAVAPDGIVYGFTEAMEGGGQSEIFWYDGKDWDRSGRLPLTDGFRVTGADFGPDGALYILERKFHLILGFASRIRRFAYGPEGFGCAVTLARTPFGALDNMEGLAVRAGARPGEVVALMVSDDNLLPVQRTMFVEMVLDPGGAC